MSSDVNSIYLQDNLSPVNYSSDGVYRFDRFRLDIPHRMLYENEQAVQLAPKVIETLIALVERRGEIVSKTELMNRVWSDSFVEEANLTQNIYLLRKMLGKDAGGRELLEGFRRRGYRFTGELSEIGRGDESDNEPVTKGARGDFDSLAVLPLSNTSADPNAEYLSDGVTESIINRLSQISRLRVLARGTVFQYKNREVAPREIGRELGVSAILTGRVLYHDERLIIRAELVDTANGWQIWGDQYDRPASDILELQETIAREISDSLHLKLTAREQELLTKRYTDNSNAYDLFIKGRYYLNKRLTDAIEQAATFFQAAVDVDPAFAPAYVGLADCYPLLSLYGALTPHEAYPKAKAAAMKALEIDDTLTKAYNSLGVIKLFYEWDWAGAEAAFRQAIELNPGYPDAHQRYGMFLITAGRFDEAETELERAAGLDPLSLITKTILGYPFYYSRRYDEAARRYREVTAADKNYSMAHFRLGLAYAQQREYAAAIEELETSIGISNDRDALAAFAYVQGLDGNLKIARQALAELDEREKSGFVTSYNRAIIEIGLGNTEAAIDWLEKAYDERSYWLIYIRVDPALDPLRGLPRFRDLQEKVFGTTDFEIQTSRKSAGTETAADIPVKRKWYLAAAGTAMLILLGLAGWFLFDSKTKRPDNQSNAIPELRFTRLTPDLNITAARLTSDGKYLVYTVLDKSKNSVWMKDLATGGLTQIQPPVEGQFWGHQISSNGFFYFAERRDSAPNYTLARRPLGGGEEKVIAENVISPSDLSPDEKQIAFVTGKGELTVAPADGNGKSRVLSQRDGKLSRFESWGSQMSWSPDGRSIAICGDRMRDGHSYPELIEVSLEDGTEKIIPTPEWNYLDDVIWLADRSELMVVARETEASPFQIWRVAYPTGEAVRVTRDTTDYVDILQTRDSHVIVAVQWLGNLNLWLGPSDDISAVKQITQGGAARDGFWGMAFAPDGKIIYTSPRSGNVDLWQLAPNGEQTQLTKNAGDWNGRPQITPDGLSIVFVSTRSGSRQLWRMDADGGNPRQLTNGYSADTPSISPDGKEVYFSLFNGEKTFLARVPADGGDAEALTRMTMDNFNPVVSPDGKLVLFGYYDTASNTPWKSGLIKAETGEVVKVFDIFLGGPAAWTADSRSIVYSHQNNSNLFRIAIDGDTKPEQITGFESGTIRAFAYSPDFKQIAVSRGNATNEAVLLENIAR